MLAAAALAASCTEDRLDRTVSVSPPVLDVEYAEYDSEPDVAENAAAALDAAASTGTIDTIVDPATVREYGGIDDALPYGATLDTDPRTWRRAGRLASMQTTVTLPNGTTDAFLAVFTLHPNGTWLLLHTVPLGSGDTP